MRWDRNKGKPEPIAALNRILEKDNGEPLVHMAEFAPTIRLIRPQVIPYVRRTVAQMCEQAAKLMPDGIYLGLVEGWRPIERQQRIYDHVWASAVEAFPGRDHAALRRTVCRWVAPTDQKAPPGHCTGAAVDLWPIDESGEVIDVFAPYSRFKAAPTYALGLTPEAKKNRMALVDAMLAVGFSNCRDEWWHYSYGDAGWAVRLGYDSCFYGLARLDHELYAELEIQHAEVMRERTNPFLS